MTAGVETPSRGPVALYLGQLAGLWEDWDAAETHLRTALELSTAMGARPHQARTHLAAGRMLLGRCRARDVRTANTHLNIALGLARDLGMARVERDATALLGQRPAGGSPLSRREQEVAALVAEGLSNRQIARRLRLRADRGEPRHPHPEQARLRLPRPHRRLVRGRHPGRLSAALSVSSDAGGLTRS